MPLSILALRVDALASLVLTAALAITH